MLSILLSWSNFYQLHVLVLTRRTHGIMTFGGMNDKLPSKNSFWKWILCAEGENDEMGIPNSRDGSRLNDKLCDNNCLINLLTCKCCSKQSGKQIMNNVLEGTVTKAMIRKMQEIIQVCKNILFKQLTWKIIVAFFKMFLYDIYVRMMVKILKWEEITE